MTAEDKAADPALVAVWVRGWAAARGAGAPEADDGAWRVEVGLPGQRRRFVYSALGPALAARACRETRPHIYLKVCAADAALRPLLPARWTIEAPHFMMVSAPEGAVAAPALADGYRMHVSGNAPCMTVRVTGADGTCAAHGYVAFVQDHAIYDRIVTEPGHQRRGLGRAVMMALGGVARDHGMRSGVLVATIEGRKLYAALGWSVHAPYSSAVILPGGHPS